MNTLCKWIEKTSNDTAYINFLKSLSYIYNLFCSQLDSLFFISYQTSLKTHVTPEIPFKIAAEILKNLQSPLVKIKLCYACVDQSGYLNFIELENWKANYPQSSTIKNILFPYLQTAERASRRRNWSWARTARCHRIWAASARPGN